MLDALTEGIPDRLKSWSLKIYGLLAALMAVVLSLTGSILTIFELYGAARVFATATVIVLAVACVVLAIWAIFFEGDDDL